MRTLLVTLGLVGVFAGNLILTPFWVLVMLGNDGMPDLDLKEDPHETMFDNPRARTL